MGFLSCIKIFLLENSWKCHIFRNDSNFFGLEYENESVDDKIIFSIGNMALQTTTKVLDILNMAKNCAIDFCPFIPNIWK